MKHRRYQLTHSMFKDGRNRAKCRYCGEVCRIGHVDEFLMKGDICEKSPGYIAKLDTEEGKIERVRQILLELK